MHFIYLINATVYFTLAMNPSQNGISREVFKENLCVITIYTQQCFHSILLKCLSYNLTINVFRILLLTLTYSPCSQKSPPSALHHHTGTTPFIFRGSSLCLFLFFEPFSYSFPSVRYQQLLLSLSIF